MPAAPGDSAPPTANAASLYTQAMKLIQFDAGAETYGLGLTRDEWNRFHMVEGVEDLTESDRELIRRAQPALELVRQAAVLPRSDFQLDLSLGHNNLRLPHLAPMRQFARMLPVEAWQRVAAGDAEGAVIAMAVANAALWYRLAARAALTIRTDEQATLEAFRVTGGAVDETVRAEAARIVERHRDAILRPLLEGSRSRRCQFVEPIGRNLTMMVGLPEYAAGLRAAARLLRVAQLLEPADAAAVPSPAPASPSSRPGRELRVSVTGGWNRRT